MAQLKDAHHSNALIGQILHRNLTEHVGSLQHDTQRSHKIRYSTFLIFQTFTGKVNDIYLTQEVQDNELFIDRLRQLQDFIGC